MYRNLETFRHTRIWASTHELHFMEIKVVAMELLEISGMSVRHKNVNECKQKREFSTMCVLHIVKWM